MKYTVDQLETAAERFLSLPSAEYEAGALTGLRAVGFEPEELRAFAGHFAETQLGDVDQQTLTGLMIGICLGVLVPNDEGL